ncbi:chondroitinase-B domain-containing protein [Neotamlana laminarinivorans]|uniref:T9SS type A sorting domain-containing protein n=1 Tax=Neotamlana laminarinivorans TaxID=2883124 RepID=A0A9X1I0L9_9FLAO|nr:chondroitinase-B domain-containing protein [Tamlana laminarinivorans]MCB4798067.1 T9SS type A sorting domain-containing protein [Tamlana laminarinivorans]
MKKPLLTLTYLLLFYFTSFAQTVSSVSDLQTALNNAEAGTIITITNGDYYNADLSIEASGTENMPIIIQAETPGGVSFINNSRIKMGGSYITLTGVKFTGDYTLSEEGASSYAISFKNGSDCNNCTVTQVQIDDYNPSSETDDFRWVRMYGQYNEISYSTFINKDCLGSMIFNQRSDGYPDYTKIHHNYFAYRNQVGTADQYNDVDVMRIGDSSESLSDSFTEIYNNYFYQVKGGEPEIIANKSGSNKFYNNTFSEYLGALSLRHGNNCEVFNNFFLNPGQTASYFNGGIRIIGEGHKIYNNYIQGTNASKQNSSSKSGGLGGINISAGQSEANFVLSGYGQVKNVLVTNNTLVDCDLGIRIGEDSGGNNQNVAPDNITVANNILFNCGDYLDEARAATNSTFEGNLVNSSSQSSTNGFTVVTNDLLQSGTTYYSIYDASDAVNASVGDYSSYFTNDVFSGNRSGVFDVGAQEYGATLVKMPYNQSDVGVTVGFGATDNTLSVSSPSLLSLGIKIYPIPVTHNVINVESSNLEITEIDIYNITGQKIISKKVDAKKHVSINTSVLKSGIYFLAINKTASSKFIVE